MSRIEVAARALIVAGVAVALATAGVLGARALFGGPKAPELDGLGPLLGVSSVVFDAERDDLDSSHGRERSVLLAVPEAPNAERARVGLLRLLGRSGWAVSEGGGAVAPEAAVCVVLSTPSHWLAEAVNAGLREPVTAAVESTDDPVVVADVFFCGREPAG